jgi:hypothetical protein
MKNSLLKIWRFIRWPLAILAVLYVAIVIWRLINLYDIEQTEKDVAAIHAVQLQLEDVYGELPPAPDLIENDKTLAGIDVNNNGIRDDVEIDIYKAHKDSARTTAAMLQYAKAVQLEFTHVYNSETLVAVIQQQGRASLCISDINKKDEIKSYIFNTEQRKRWREEIYDKYMTSYGLDNEGCDLPEDSFEN